MEAGVDDPVHVEVEIVEFDAVRVWTARVDGTGDTIDDCGHLFEHVDHRERVSLHQPSIECGNSHFLFFFPLSLSAAKCRKRERERE